MAQSSKDVMAYGKNFIFQPYSLAIHLLPLMQPVLPISYLLFQNYSVCIQESYMFFLFSYLHTV